MSIIEYGFFRLELVIPDLRKGWTIGYMLSSYSSESNLILELVWPVYQDFENLALKIYRITDRYLRIKSLVYSKRMYV